MSRVFAALAFAELVKIRKTGYVAWKLARGEGGLLSMHWSHFLGRVGSHTNGHRVCTTSSTLMSRVLPFSIASFSRGKLFALVVKVFIQVSWLGNSGVD